MHHYDINTIISTLDIVREIKSLLFCLHSSRWRHG